MRVRKLDVSGDMSFGHGQSDFYRDQPEAPAQCVQTRLALRTDEWFLDKTAGTPWSTKILGKYTASTRDQVLRARILKTQGVTKITAYSSIFDPETRKFSVPATIDTAYGTTTIAGLV